MYFFGLLNGAALRQLSSTFEVAIQLSLAGEQATIHQIQEEAQAFHMNPIAEIFMVK